MYLTLRFSVRALST